MREGGLGGRSPLAVLAPANSLARRGLSWADNNHHLPLRKPPLHMQALEKAEEAADAAVLLAPKLPNSNDDEGNRLESS